MSRMRILGVAVLASVVLLGASACSSDEKKATKSDRPPISFAEPPEGSTDIGLCYAYDLEQIKDLIGGDETFKRLAPTAIGAEGDKVRGEACGWQRTEPNGDALSLRVEVRDFGEDEATLLSQYAALKEGTIDATDVEGIGQGAFSAVTDETSLLQIKSSPYLLTLSSRADGTLKPVPLKALELLGASGLEQIQ
jgi:hypothetical protein